MATQQYGIKYRVGFETDQASLQKTVNEAISALQKIGTNSQFGVAKELQDASSAAYKLGSILKNSINMDTGKFEIEKFQQKLQQSGMTLEQYRDELAQLGPQGKNAFGQVADAITSAELPMRRVNTLLDKLWTTMKNTIRWQFTSRAWMTLLSSIRTAYSYSQDLNESLNNIRIVTGHNADEMARFAENANKAAAKLNTTTTEYTDASRIYFQQGLDDAEVERRTAVTIKLANAAGISAEQASSQLTAIWNNFSDGSDNLERYADVLVKLGATTASSSEEISKGMQKFAAVADTVGLSYDYAASALATIVAETRTSAEEVGTSLRTIFARFESLKLGETLEDGVDLNKYTAALASVGVNVLDSNGKLRQMDDILDDLFKKWQNLNQAQQNALATTVAGVRQYANFIALFKNADTFYQNVGTAQGATGALQEQADIYAQSWEAAKDQVKNAAQDIYDSLINADFFIDFDNNILAPLLHGIASVIDGFGGLKGLLPTIAGYLTMIFGPQITSFMDNFAYNLRVISGIEAQRARDLQAEAMQLKAGMAVDTGDTTEQERVGIENQVLKLKTKILQTSTQYSEAQQEAIRTQANLIDELIAQWKKATAQAKEYEDTVEYTKSNLSNKVKEKLSQALQAKTVEGQEEINKQLSKNINTKLYTRPEALQGYKGRSDKDLISFFGDKDIANIKQEIQKQINELEGLLQEGLKIGSLKDIEELKNNLKAAKADLEALNNITVTPKIDISQLDLEESEEIFEKGSILNLKLNLEATDAKGKIAEILGSVDKLQSLFDQLGTRAGGLEAIWQQFAQLDTSTKLSKEEVEALSAEFKQLGLNPDQFVHEGDTIQQVLDQISQATKETKTVNEEWIGALEKVADTNPDLKELLDHLKQIKETSRQAAKANVEAAGAYHQAANGVVVLAKKSEEADKQVKSFSQQATMAIQGVTAGLGAINAFSSSIKILGDSSADATAKFGAVRSMVYSAIPAINSLGKAIEGIKNKTAVAGGWITIVITVLATLISVLSEAGVFKTPFEKAAESVKKYKEELEDLNNSIESNEKELETMQKRMKELEAIKVPSLAEAEELENLRVKNSLLAYQTEELKRQRKETQKLLADERKRMAESGSDAMSDAVRSKRGGFFADVGDFITGIFNPNQRKMSQSDKWVSQRALTNFMENQNMSQIQAYLAIGSVKYAKEFKAAREQALLEYRQEFRETEQAALQDFQDYVELQTELGLPIAEEQTQLLVDTMKQYWLDDFEKGYVGPILSGLSQSYGKIVEAIVNGKALTDDQLQKLWTSGLTLEDAEGPINQLREKMAIVTGGEHWLQSLTGEQIAYILTIDWQGKTPAEIQQETRKHFAEIEEEAQVAAASILAYDKATHQSILDKIAATKDLTDKELEYLQALEEEYDLLNLLSGDRSSAAYQRELFNIQNLEEARNIVRLGKYVDADTGAALDEYNAATQAKEEAYQRKSDAHKTKLQAGNDYAASLGQTEVKKIIWNWSDAQREELQELMPGVVGVMRAQLDNKNLTREDVASSAKDYMLKHGQSFADDTRLSQYIESVLQAVEGQSLDAEKVVQNALGDIGDLIVDASVEAAKSFEKATKEYKEATDTYLEAVDNQNKAAEKLEKKLENVNINFKELVKNAQEFGAALAADVATDFSYIQGQFDSFAKAEETLASSSTYTWEQMQTIAQAYPDILAAATVTSEGIWTLNEETAESAKESAKVQVMAEIDAAIHKSNLAVQYYQRQVDIYDDLIDAFDETNATEEELKEAYSKSITSIDQAEKETLGQISNALAQSVNADEDSMAQAAADDSTIYSNSWVTAYQEVQKAYEDLVKARIAGDQAMIASAQENFDLALRKAAEMKKTTASLLSSQTADSHVAEGDWTFGYKGGIDEWLAELEGTPEQREQARKAALKSFKALRKSAAENLADEKVRLSGLYALKNSFSTGDFSTDKSKKSGSGSKSEAKEKEALKWQLERYHEISREIAYQERQVSKLDKTISRAYGANKLQAFADKEKALNKQLVLEQEKLQEASEKWLEADKAALEELGVGVQFDAGTGEISNYSKIMTAAADAQQKAIDKYNAYVKEHPNATTEELKKYQEAMDATQERMSDITDAIKNYEDSLTKVAEQQEKVAEIQRSIADNRLAAFDATLQLKLDVQSVKDAVNELNKAFIQANGDVLDYGVDLLGAREKDFDGLMTNIKSKLEYANQLAYELKNQKEETDVVKITENLKNTISELMSDAKSALEFIAEWEKLYADAVNAAMERFNWYISRLSHNSSVASTIKELLTLQGVTNKTADGFGKLQKVLQTQLDAAITQGKLQKDAYDYWTAQVAIANENWNSVKDNVNDINYDRYKNDLQAVIAQQEAAQDAMLASAKESMELARTMYEEQLERAKIEFEQIMTDGSSISELQKQFDHFIDENERYFDEVNTAFQIADWQAKLQADIDNTTNAAHRQQLQLLQEEIETRAEGGKLNQYDLDILNAKYNQMQALMALEDARNNKNTLRLVRDSQGNWNYQYTNNADDVAAQEQKLAQANNEYYNIAKKQTQDVTSQIISLWQECEDEVNEIFKDSTLTEEERNAKVAERRAYYAQKAADLEREKAQAIADMTAAASAAGMEFSNSYIARLSEMTAKNVDFEANLDDLLNKCSGYYNNFSAVVAGVTEDTGTDISSLDGYTNDLAESTRNFGDDAEEAWGKAKTALEEYAEVLNSLVPTMEEASQMAQNLKTVGDAAAKTVEKTSGLGYHDEIVYDQLGAYAKSAGASTDVLRQIYSERQMKISANPELSKYSMSWEEFLEHINGLTKYQVGNISDATLAKFKDWLNLMGIQSLATGGYTGDFTDGRLALLHEKELVLNASDTKNILTAVTLTRQMAAMLEAAIDGSANAGLALMRSRFGERVEIPTLPGDQLEQMIHIDQIEFPNVTTASEIQEAFRNLADNASQWARRRKS